MNLKEAPVVCRSNSSKYWLNPKELTEPDPLFTCIPSPKRHLSTILFGGEDELHMSDFYDFEIANYRYLLDNVQTLADLLAGLSELRPFADDALEVASRFAQSDFQQFKGALRAERQAALDDTESRMPTAFIPILVPNLFLSAFPIADQCEVPLGCALTRLLGWGPV